VLQRALVLQISSDAGRRRAALDSTINILLPDRPSLTGLAAGRAKQRAIRIAGDAGGFDIVVEDPFQAVVTGQRNRRSAG
jgi:hypothetical protein